MHLNRLLPAILFFVAFVPRLTANGQHFSAEKLLEIYNEPRSYFGEYKSLRFGRDTTYMMQLDTAAGQKVLFYSLKKDDICVLEVEATKMGFRRSIKYWPLNGADESVYYTWGNYVAVLYEKNFRTAPTYFVAITYNPHPGASPRLLFR